MHRACIDGVKKRLAEKGLELQLDEGFSIDMKTGEAKVHFSLQTKKKNGKKGPPLLIKNCPFCGIEIDS